MALLAQEWEVARGNHSENLAQVDEVTWSPQASKTSTRQVTLRVFNVLVFNLIKEIKGLVRELLSDLRYQEEKAGEETGTNKCGGLSENDPTGSHICMLSSQLEEICYWGVGFDVSKAQARLSQSLPLSVSVCLSVCRQWVRM